MAALKVETKHKSAKIIMKNLFIYAALLLMLSSYSAAGYAIQSGGGESTKKEPKRELPKVPRKENVREPKRPTSKPRTLALSDLVVRSNPSGSTILLNGEMRGVTDNNGQLNLRGLKPGSYVLTIRKAGYRDEQRTIGLPAGQSSVVEVELTSLPGQLSITTNLEGAEIEVGNVGSYTGKVSGLSLSPGSYQIKVSNSGYRTINREVEVKAAEILELPITLEPIPVEEVLGQATDSFRASNYAQVIAICKSILASKPEQPRANLLMGLSYFYSGLYSDSFPYLSKAVALGEQIILPIRHHHRVFLSDDLCTGRITIGAGIFAFNSTNRTGHDFSVPANKIYELKPEPQKAGRIHTQVGVQKGAKEDKKTYNFHVIRAGTRRYDPNNPSSITVVYCDNCVQETQLIYQLLEQLKHSSSNLTSEPTRNNETSGRPTLKRREPNTKDGTP